MDQRSKNQNIYTEPTDPEVDSQNNNKPVYQNVQENGQAIGWKPSLNNQNNYPVTGQFYNPENSSVRISLPSGPSERKLSQVTLEATKDDITNQSPLTKKDRRGWKDYNSHEKMLYRILALICAVTLIMVISGIFAIRNLRKPEEIVYPTPAPNTTLIPPWLTTTSTVSTTTSTTTTTEHPATNTCLDKDCARAAGRMMEMMSSKDVDPCEDFYQYACGGFLEKDIPDSESLWDQFTITEEAWAKDFRELFQASPVNDSEAVAMASQVYDSCLNLDNTADYTELRAQIDELLQPGIDDLTGVLANLRKNLGANYIFKSYIDTDETNSDKNVTIYIDQPEFGLARPFLSDPNHKSQAAYKNLIEEVYNKVFGSGGAQAAEAALKIEVGLEELSAIPEDRRNKTAMYNPMPVQELIDLNLELDNNKILWDKFFGQLFQDIYELEVEPLELEVVVRDLEYFTELNEFLGTMTNDELEFYLKWRVLHKLAPVVSLELEQIFFNYEKITRGLYSAPRQWRICSEKTNALMGPAIAYAYLQDHPVEETRTKVENMFTMIKENFLNLIINTPDSYQWISPETKLRIVEKLGNLKIQIAYPEFLESLDGIEDYYGNLTLEVQDSFLQNVLDITKWESISGLQKLGQENDIKSWNHDPLVVNAFYSLTNNSIIIPAGILRLPWFGNSVEYLNMAGLGSVISHEIIHALDDIGRQYDSVGTLTEWWDEESLANFTELASCFVNQYDQYEVPELAITLNGNNTLGENIADNGGFNLARETYMTYLSGEKVLPGFDAAGFTVDQLYYLAYAQTFCGSYTNEELETTVKVDTHSPDEFRLRGVIRNSAAFKSVWNCPAEETRDQEMCSVW